MERRWKRKETVGRKEEVKAIMDEIIKDRIFYMYRKEVSRSPVANP